MIVWVLTVVVEVFILVASNGGRDWKSEVEIICGVDFNGIRNVGIEWIINCFCINYCAHSPQ